jgi:hypothetical protein
MKVKDSAVSSVPFRLDDMSKARIAWIKAHYPQLKPTGSLIIRRALVVYLAHLEKALVSPDRIEAELMALKGCQGGDGVPWESQPDFGCVPMKPLSKFISEAHKDRLGRAFSSSPFASRANHTRREAPL